MTRPGVVIWLTGLPAGGKTTLAHALVPLLAEAGFPALVLDSDEMRQVFTPDPAYTDLERDWFYTVLGRLAAWLARNGTSAIVAATAHRQAYRNQARTLAPHFYEVYVDCPPAVARQRDPKGLYARADTGEIRALPGVGVPYEPPPHPEATVDTSRMNPTEAAAAVLAQLDLPA